MLAFVGFPCGCNNLWFCQTLWLPNSSWDWWIGTCLNPMLFVFEELILRLELETLQAFQRYRRKVAVKSPSVPVCLELTKWWREAAHRQWKLKRSYTQLTKKKRKRKMKRNSFNVGGTHCIRRKIHLDCWYILVILYHQDLVIRLSFKNGCGLLNSEMVITVVIWCNKQFSLSAPLTSLTLS